LIRRILIAQGVPLDDSNPRAVLAAISDAKNGLTSAAEFASLARDSYTRAVAQVYSVMERELRASNAVTFDDLLALPVELFARHPEILGQYRMRFQHILVDEYQDTNHAQYKFIAMLGAEHQNVTVVGDDDQSIYGWRGADIRNILQFEREFPGAHVVRLEENYRSTPEILKVANAVIAHNEERRGKVLRATLPPGEPVTLTAALDERDEAEFIADEIASRTLRNRDLSLRDFAVVYRTNAQSRILEEVFRRRSIPYRLVGTVGFFERREVKDLLAYLRLMANPRDDLAFRRAIAVPRRGIGETSLEHLAARARESGISMLEAARSAEHVAALRPAARSGLAGFAGIIGLLEDQAAEASVADLVRSLVERIGYRAWLEQEDGDPTDRLENVAELISSAEEMISAAEGDQSGGRPLDLFLQQVSLLADVDSLDPAADAVTLMTVHNAKGLEFPIVFISGLEDGLFPLARAYDDPRMLEEERRLLYVGITRAERKLFLSYAGMRRRNGEMREGIASSFIRQVPRSLLPQQPTIKFRSTARAGTTTTYSTSSRTTYGVPARRPRAAEEDYSQENVRVRTGARVRHDKFGSGTVADVTGVGKDAKVTVDFDDESVGRKRIVLAYSGLQNDWDE
jgi:DNA helicase-2/ATP-dependent DNA helicase PcrA